VVERDATRPGRASRAADLVLLDPPYRSGLIAPALTALAEFGWLAPDAVAVAETEAREALETPAGFELVDQRRYGRAGLHFLRRIGPA
jgi:16S rRNA (guanine966-N2)-methyltransferase